MKTKLANRLVLGSYALAVFLTVSFLDLSASSHSKVEEHFPTFKRLSAELFQCTRALLPFAVPEFSFQVRSTEELIRSVQDYGEFMTYRQRALFELAHRASLHQIERSPHSEADVAMAKSFIQSIVYGKDPSLKALFVHALFRTDQEFSKYSSMFVVQWATQTSFFDEAAHLAKDPSLKGPKEYEVARILAASLALRDGYLYDRELVSMLLKVKTSDISSKDIRRHIALAFDNLETKIQAHLRDRTYKAEHNIFQHYTREELESLRSKMQAQRIRFEETRWDYLPANAEDQKIEVMPGGLKPRPSH